jgi:hypothetical protein
VDIRSAIESAKMYLRRDVWFQEPDWKSLLNAAQMDFASRAHTMHDDFEIPLVPGTAEYDVSAAGMMNVSEPPVLNGTALTVLSRDALYARIGTHDLTLSGTPQYMYPISETTVGFYPVPADADVGAIVLVHGSRYPQEITADTPLETELPFEPIDHPTLVLGMVAQAERIDKDVVVARDIVQLYDRGIQSARHRDRVRFPGTSRVRRV